MPIWFVISITIASLGGFVFLLSIIFGVIALVRKESLKTAWTLFIISFLMSILGLGIPAIYVSQNPEKSWGTSDSNTTLTKVPTREAGNLNNSQYDKGPARESGETF